jgi:hypothetical protein
MEQTYEEQLTDFIEKADVDSDELRNALVDEVFGDTFRDYVFDIIGDWDEETCEYTLKNLKSLFPNAKMK